MHNNTVIGAVPQDFNWKGDEGHVVMGDENIIRENVVINRSTFSDGKTEIGSRNFLMEGTHVSHDTKIGHRGVLGYGSKIAGDCEIGHAVILSTGVIVNAQVRIGGGTMIQAGSRISKDVPPFIVAGGNPVEYGGVNHTILKGYGIPQKAIDHLANAYRLVFHGQTAVIDAIHQIKQQVPPGKEVDEVVEFLKETKLGIICKL